MFVAGCIFLITVFMLDLEDADWTKLQTLAWIISGLILVSYLLQIAARQFVFFSTRNIVLLGVIYWVLSDVLQMIPQVHFVDPQIAIRAMFYVFLFVLFVQIGYLIPPSRWAKKKFLDFKDPKMPNLSFIILCVAFCIGILPYFYYSDWSLSKVIEGIMSSRYSQVEVGWRREFLGDERAVVLGLDFFFVAFPSMVTFYLMAFKKSYGKKIFLVCLMFLVCIAEFYMGTRQIFGFVVLVPLLTFYLTLPRKKRHWFTIFLIVIVFILFFLMEIQLYQRSSGFFKKELPNLTSEVKERYVTVDDNFFQFARLISFVPEKYNYVFFNEIWYLIVRPIPRILWEGKPTGFGLFYARNILGYQDTTFSYSVLGDFYVSFGIFGILLGGIFFGWLCRNVDQWIPYLGISKFGLVLFALCAFTMGMAVRSLQIFILFGYYLFVFFIVAKIISFSFKK